MLREKGAKMSECDCSETCACYVEGYVAGKDKAHFEIRHILDGTHADGCGCEPCLTVRLVAIQLARRWGGTI